MQQKKGTFLYDRYRRETLRVVIWTRYALLYHKPFRLIVVIRREHLRGDGACLKQPPQISHSVGNSGGADIQSSEFQHPPRSRRSHGCPDSPSSWAPQLSRSSIMASPPAKRARLAWTEGLTQGHFPSTTRDCRARWKAGEMAP